MEQTTKPTDPWYRVLILKESPAGRAAYNLAQACQSCVQRPIRPLTNVTREKQKELILFTLQSALLPSHTFKPEEDWQIVFLQNYRSAAKKAVDEGLYQTEAHAYADFWAVLHRDRLCSTQTDRLIEMIGQQCTISLNTVFTVEPEEETA